MMLNPESSYLDGSLTSSYGLIKSNKIIKNDTVMKSIQVAAITAYTVFGTEKNTKKDGCGGY